MENNASSSLIGLIDDSCSDVVWRTEHEDLAPDCEPDQVFVVKYQIFYLDEDYTPQDDYESGDQFRYYITTARLVRFSSNFKLIFQTDGTYKLLWIGNSVLLEEEDDVALLNQGPIIDKAASIKRRGRPPLSEKVQYRKVVK